MKPALLAVAALAFAHQASAETWQCIDSGDGHRYTVSQSVPGDVCKLTDKVKSPHAPDPQEPLPKSARNLRGSKMAVTRKSGVLIGMTSDEVLQSSWGRPQRVSKTITAYSRREQWIYGNGDYLYFEDGVLTVIQK